VKRIAALGIAALALALSLSLSGVARSAPAVRAVGCIGMTVADADRSLAFYTGVLQFARKGESERDDDASARLAGVAGLRERVVTLALGDECLELHEAIAPPGRPIAPGGRSNDLAFQHIAIVVRDMDAAYAELRRARVRQVSPEPQRIPDWNEAAAGIRALYFRDPDDHNLELIWFPRGKGDGRWQVQTDRLFLGIDHTAIAVSDSQASLAFYRDALGLRVAGAGTNYGPEQERLNGVFASRVRITGLRAPSGPGIEFLEYLSPADGRPAPLDLHANDVAFWSVTLEASDVEDLGAQAAARGGHWVSPGAIAVPRETNGFAEGLLLRDPDGHHLRLVEK
jgi:catechol 2,3-dioxygenase-like lactoylglutathione lyase family enzyme